MPNLQLRFGPMMIGAFFNAILYGVIVVQTLTYYQTYKQDKAWLRYFVLYLFIAETVNTGMDIAVVYEPLVLQFGTPEALKFLPLTLAADAILTVLISTPIQFFFAWRIKVLTEGRATWLAILICIFAITSFGAGIWLTVGTIQIRLASRMSELLKIAPLWLLSSAVTDLTITCSLITILYRQRTGFKKTDDVVNKIIRLTVQTGFITTLFAILDVICFLGIKGKAVNFIWDFPLAKLYMNTLMSSLNARAAWRNLNEQADNVPLASNARGLQFRTPSISNTHTTPALQSTGSDPESVWSPGVSQYKGQSGVAY